jgi:hypothetical protein
MLVSHGVESPGLTPIERWRALVGRGRDGGGFLGVDEEAYPADLGAYLRYYPAVKRLPSRYPIIRLTELEVDAFLAEHGQQYEVDWA